MPSTDRERQEATDRRAHASRVAQMREHGERAQARLAETLSKSRSASAEAERQNHASHVAQVLGRAVEDGQIEY